MTATSGVASEAGRSTEAVINDARQRQRRRRIRFSLAALIVAAVALVAYGQFRNQGGTPGGSVTHSSSPQAAAMPQSNGWNGGSARIPNTSCPRCVQLDSWAATVPYRDAPNDFPHRTMAILGRDDIIIQVSRSWQPNEPAWALEHHLLRIVPSQIHANFEGNTTHGRVSLWLAQPTWRAGSSIGVLVYFGTPTPSAAAIARAQQELDATSFPLWSIKN